MCKPPRRRRSEKRDGKVPSSRTFLTSWCPTRSPLLHPVASVVMAEGTFSLTATDLDFLLDFPWWSFTATVFTSKFSRGYTHASILAVTWTAPRSARTRDRPGFAFIRDFIRAMQKLTLSFVSLHARFREKDATALRRNWRRLEKYFFNLERLL